MSSDRRARCPNRLINEKSPYLLQHANNPVDWYPWSDEAFEVARKADKLVFLSIGYSTCHWCHVMERESFEHEAVADILNREYVSVKVDREERPDVDHVYMTVCQALTGRGGWPLTIIMTPERKPVFAATYLPRTGRLGAVGLMDVLAQVARAWKENRPHILSAGDCIASTVQDSYVARGSLEESIDPEAPDHAYHMLRKSFDTTYGGFGPAPKFPAAHNIIFLLRYGRLRNEPEAVRMAEKTLTCMHNGGIYDHVGFGFSRYSTDRKWLAPHFEKMLCDNAMLTIAYLEAYQATGAPEYGRVADEVLGYVLRDMTSPEGAFFSAEDADSEGVEGRFYVWTPEEVRAALGDEDGAVFCRLYGITERGNFEGKSIPNLVGASEERLKEAAATDELRLRLLRHRERRVRPARDDKVLTAWNGIMIAALAIAGRSLGGNARPPGPSYAEVAEKAARFVLSKLRRPDGRLLARYRDGEGAFLAYLDDYAFFIWGLIELYESTYDPRHLQTAVDLNEDMLRHFWDPDHGGLFLYGDDGERLMARPKDVVDGAMPSGNSVAAMNFLRLARLTALPGLEEKAEQQFRAFGRTVNRGPAGATHLLTAFLHADGPSCEIVIVGDSRRPDTHEMVSALRRYYLPHSVSLLYPTEASKSKEVLDGLAPHLRHYAPQDGKATAYLCSGRACQPPLTDPRALGQKIAGLAHPATR